MAHTHSNDHKKAGCVYNVAVQLLNCVGLSCDPMHCSPPGFLCTIIHTYLQFWFPRFQLPTVKYGSKIWSGNSRNKHFMCSTFPSSFYSLGLLTKTNEKTKANNSSVLNCLSFLVTWWNLIPTYSVPQGGESSLWPENVQCLSCLPISHLEPSLQSDLLSWYHCVWF